jgi:hypothetical protein
MTVAVAEALLKGGRADDFTDSMKKWGRLYPKAGYGPAFGEWLASDNRMPYGSFGNGSAMRVSPCAWFAASLEEAEKLAEKSAAVTHDHPEGIKGAKATAAATWLAKAEGAEAKQTIKEYIEGKYGYNLSRRLDDIRPNYRFDATCQGSVPEAIIAFLESDGFEDAIRNAVSLGGDSDTLAAMAGGMAEAHYGIPDVRYAGGLGNWDPTYLTVKTFSLLGDPLASVINAWLGAGRETGLPIMGKGHYGWETHGFSKPHTIRLGEGMRLGEAEFAVVRLGLGAYQMEDKWHICFDDGRLSCRRSWTGNIIYEATFRKIDSSYVMNMLVVERDQEIYGRTDDAEDFASFCFLVHAGLLGKRSKKPRGKDVGSMLRDLSEFGKLSVQS